jgi:hypothetical protein
MISPFSAVEGGKCWATPACLVTAVNGLVHVPVTNGDDRTCCWRDLRGKIEAVEFDDEVEAIREDKKYNVVAALEVFEPEWLNCPIDSFDHLLDEGLTEEQASEIKAILERHRRLFSKKKGLTHLVEHHIVTGDSKPVSTKPARVSPPERIIIKNLVQAMMDDDVIEHSNSPWCSRVVLAPKPNGSGIRFCVDYRAINKVTVRDVHPLPVMEVLIGHLDGATYYSSVDPGFGRFLSPTKIDLSTVDELRVEKYAVDRMSLLFR